ncbi:MAG: enolase C-terminal domain-like protein [Planctomycetaceae bacterium]
MHRRRFLQSAAALSAGMTLDLSPMRRLWAALPSAIKITGLKTRIVDDEVYLKVFTDQGITGEGHTTVHRKAATCQAAVQDLERVLVGEDASRIEFLWQGMYRWPRWRGGPILNAAISGIDLALWDILGKALDAPVYRLIGGAARDRVRLYVHGTGREGVQKAKAEGYTAIKTPPLIGEGSGDKRVIKRPWNLKKAVQAIEEMRIEAGDEFDILIDAHGLLTPTMSLEYAKAIEPYRVMFLEEPIQLEGNDTLEWLGQHTTVPLATGERHTTKWMFEDILARHLVSYVQPDVIQCGGITELKKIAAMAEAQFIDVAPHCPGSMSTGLGLASLHCSFSIPNFAIQESHPNPTGERLDLFSGRTVTIKDGYAHAPEWPGLGLQLNEEVAKTLPAANPNPKVYHEDGSVADY